MRDFDIMQFIRPNLLALKPYGNAFAENQGRKGILLDANENPYGTLNRYPDAEQSAVRKALAEKKGLSPEQILIGNGSDELIDLCFRVFSEPGKDKAIVCPPTFGMYEFFAAINQTEIIKIPLDDDFQLNQDAIDEAAGSAKMLFLCSPNNPTGNLMKKAEEAISRFSGIVVLDEAYIDFSPQASLLPRLTDFPNLIILQTFSKARAMAAARIGVMYAAPEITDCFFRIKSPYNVSQLNSEAALKALKNESLFQSGLKQILSEKKRLGEALNTFSCIEKCFPSDANFFLCQSSFAKRLYKFLKTRSIQVRDRSCVVPNSLRISVGTKEENDTLIENLNRFETITKRSIS